MRGSLLIILLLGLAAPAWAGDASQFHHRVERLVASPTPAGPLTLLEDHAAWRADVPPGIVVLVEARSDGGALFALRCAPLAAPDALVLPAATRQACLLGSAGAWRVHVDPDAGAAVSVDVTFRGAFGDVGQAPAAFSLTLLRDGPACVVPGACLP